MGIGEERAADAVLSDDRSDACECYVEARCLGKLRREQPELNPAGIPGLSCQSDREDSGIRRVGLQVQMKQLEP